MSNRIRVGVLFGGRSCEHEVSVMSARSMLQAMDTSKYEVTMIGISKEGRWLLPEDTSALLDSGVVEGEDLTPVLLDYPGSQQLLCVTDAEPGAAAVAKLDVIFPLLHGPYGEDGTVQGLLDLADVAYVGSGVLGSAVGMDKEMAKRAFLAEGLRQTEHACFRRSRWGKEPDAVIAEIENALHYPLFVKPANLGSSVGISKAETREKLRAAIETAARYDLKIIVEEGLEDCHEVECSVLGNEDPEASVVGEIIPGHDFYDYEAKYVDDSSDLIIPARLDEKTATEIRNMAVRAFKAVDAAGLARVDFFVSRLDGLVYLNEINTMPGFTPISMYPKLWDASGIGYAELIDRLIELALERHRERQGVQSAL